MASASEPNALESNFAHLAGKRVVIISYGSRGDVQPFVALGSQLEKAGAQTLILTNVDHESFIAAFGLRAVGAASSCRDDHTRPEFANGIATGEFGPFWAWQLGEKRKSMPEIAKRELEAVQHFKPDLIYATPLTYQNACSMSEQLKIPMILGTLFPTTNPFSSMGWRPFRQPSHPTLVHWSAALTKSTFWQHDTHKVTGFLVVSGQDGHGPGTALADDVFGGAAERGRLEAFLTAGSAPVYMGWGSMVVPRKTTALAIRALKRAGLRGVISAGWAALSPDDLEGEAALKQYAADNVLFVQSVPHEWLMPRCAATVHHGGAGTVAAALRSGVPTVITPCAIDQPDNAKIVEQSGCGIALPQYAKLTAEALGDALAACIADETMRATCRHMAELLREEDGLVNAVAEIDKYLGSLAQRSPDGEKSGPPPIFKAIGRFMAERKAA